MPAWEGKKYKLESSVNFDEYMKALGVSFVTRKLGKTHIIANFLRPHFSPFFLLPPTGNTVSPTIELLKDGDEYTLNTVRINLMCPFII